MISTIQKSLTVKLENYTYVCLIIALEDHRYKNITKLRHAINPQHFTSKEVFFYFLSIIFFFFIKVINIPTQQLSRADIVNYINYAAIYGTSTISTHIVACTSKHHDQC